MTTRWQEHADGWTALYGEGEETVDGAGRPMGRVDRTAAIWCEAVAGKERYLVVLCDGVKDLSRTWRPTLSEAMDAADDEALSHGWEVDGGRPTPAP